METMPVAASPSRNVRIVFGSAIDVLTWEQTLARISGWAALRESRYVCICNVHSVMTARYDEYLRHVLNSSDMATPDGMPVAWMLRLRGIRKQRRINGPDLMWKYCKLAEKTGQPVYFYGGATETLDALRVRLLGAFPALQIAGLFSPPFRPLGEEEEMKIVEMINRSGAGVVFVGLGCPKQEIWMAQQRGKIHAVMIGVGAAFDYHAGTLKRAPQWMQHAGLEWFYRLMKEPRRLWRRYLVTNSLFLFHMFGEFLRGLQR